MLRVFILLNLLFFNTYACKGGYDSCKHKILDSNVIVNQSLFIPLFKNQKLIFTTDNLISKKYKIIKYDPFLSLYLIKNKNKFKYPFRLNKHPYLGVSAVNKVGSIEGKIQKKQFGLKRFATFNNALFTPSLLLTSCCSIEGIVTNKGIIEKTYIKHFLNKKKIIYGDIGVRLSLNSKNAMVESIDPFIKDNPFKIGDIILNFNANKVSNKEFLMKNILFSKIGKIYKIKIRRDSNILNLKVKTRKRYGGGFISDTFLERKGLYFDDKLNIIKIKKSIRDYGLKIGDKLIQVNGERTNNQQDVMKYISSFKNSALLLFERDNFQFFVHIN